MRHPAISSLRHPAISSRWTSIAIAIASAFAGPRAASAQWVGDGVSLCAAANDQYSPAIVSDGSGGAIVAWQDERSGNSDIYAQHILSSGAVDPAWPVDGRALCTASNNQTAPVIVSDGAHGAIVAWTDRRGGAQTDIYAQHVLASGAVDPAWPVDGAALCLATGNQQGQVIATDGGGGAIVAWEDQRVAGSNIYAQHVLASGAADPAWPLNGRALCAAADAQLHPDILADGAGGAIVAWEDRRSGTQYDIYAQRVLASGAVDPAWPLDGRALCAATDNQLTPAIAGDGAGGAIVVWQDRRGGVDNDVYAQHVSQSGVVDPAWPVDGALICDAANDQNTPALITDGSGGAIVTWEDYRGANAPDIYAQRIRSTGTVDPAWPVNGRALCTASYEQQSPIPAPDGAGGAIVTWYDFRSHTNYDVYAQHLKSTGAVDGAWPFNGRALCDAAGDQYSPVIAINGANGALVAWYDYRGGATSDIYVNRVFMGGGVAAVGPGLDPDGFLLGAPWPNPMSGESMTVELTSPISAFVRVEVLDLSGRRVRGLAAGVLAAGRHSLTWNGADERGRRVPIGVYLVRAECGSQVSTRKVTRLH